MSYCERLDFVTVLRPAVRYHTPIGRSFSGRPSTKKTVTSSRLLVDRTLFVLAILRVIASRRNYPKDSNCLERCTFTAVSAR